MICRQMRIISMRMIKRIVIALKYLALIMIAIV